MPEPTSNPNDTIAFTGKIGDIVHTAQPDGRIFERYRRAPGTRIIIISPDNKILVTKEHRQEANGVDLRLPGGKVCDTIDAYHELLASGQDIAEAATRAAQIEAIEETGFSVKNLELVTIATAGATVEWDLYYFATRDYVANKNGQQPGQGEEDIEVTWMSATEITNAIASGQMNEWRSVGVLLGLILPKCTTNRLD